MESIQRRCESDTLWLAFYVFHSLAVTCETQVLSHRILVNEQNSAYFDFCCCDCVHLTMTTEKAEKRKERQIWVWSKERKNNIFVLILQQPTEYFDMGIFLAFFVVVSLVCLILLVKIKLKQRRSQVRAVMGYSLNAES